MINNIKIIAILILINVHNIGNAQETVSGTVTSAEGPLPGVNVMIQGSTYGNITDMEGKYTLIIPDPNVTLIFSYVGYKTVTEPIGNRKVIDVFMEDDPTQLEEVVVTGYITQERKNISGAVSVIDPKEINTIPASNVTQQLQGRAPGVNVLYSGRPGGPVKVNIRGVGTINDNDPLYIVDGMPCDWETVSVLNPNDVESIQILKDASASSIYGARAANGVIIFTTKKSKGTGETQLNFDAYFGVQFASNLPQMLNPDELANVIRISKENQGLPLEHPQYQLSDGTWGLPDYIIPYGHSISLDGPVDESLYDYEIDTLRFTRANQTGTDWLDEIFNPAIIQNYNLTASGGNENGQYLFSMGYFDQEGVVTNTDYKKFTFTVNTIFNISKKVRIGENLIIGYHKATNDFFFENDYNREGTSSALRYALLMSQIVPVYDVGGNFAGNFPPGISGGLNPVAYANRNKDNVNENIRLMGSVFLEIDILDDLLFKSSFSPNYKLTFEHKYFAAKAPENSGNIGNNTLAQFNTNSFNWTWYNTLSYNQIFNNRHQFQFLIGTEAINDKITYLSASRSTYLSEELNYRHLRAGESDYTNDGISEEWSLFSVFAKVDYNYKGKYLLSGTLRRDGSSRFGSGNKYGIFPAISAAWRISSENFMATVGIIDDLKIRIGWGQTGNQNIGNYRAYNVFGLDIRTANYDIRGTNNNVVSGFQSIIFGNPEAKWETTTTTNIGFDLSMFANSLTINFDWYNRITEDMLTQLPPVGTKGYAEAPYLNIGEMSNRGIDLGIMYSSREISDFSWSAGINFTQYVNEVTNLYDPDFELLIGSNITQEGHPIAEFYGYKILGIFQDEEEVNNSPLQENAGPGRWKYADINGDSLINSDDRTYIGSPHPDFIIGIPLNLNYKRFYLNIFLTGSFGNEIYNENREIMDFISWPTLYTQASKTILQSWGMPGVNNLKATLPQVVQNPPLIEYGNSSYFIENGSYLRFNQLIVGYNFKVDTWNAIKQFRIYAQANNLFTLTNYGGFDPVIPQSSTLIRSIDNAHYPNVRSCLIGINIIF